MNTIADTGFAVTPELVAEVTKRIITGEGIAPADKTGIDLCIARNVKRLVEVEGMEPMEAATRAFSAAVAEVCEGIVGKLNAT